MAAVPGRHPYASSTDGVKDFVAWPWPFKARPHQPPTSEDHMQFFIALGIMVVASSAYLVHQFWSRTLSSDGAQRIDATVTDETPPSQLKAA